MNGDLGTAAWRGVAAGGVLLLLAAGLAPACGLEEFEEGEGALCEEGEECATAQEEVVGVEAQGLKSGGIDRSCSNTVFEKEWTKPTGIDWTPTNTSAYLQECGSGEVLVGVRGWQDTNGVNQGIRNLQAMCRALGRVNTQTSSQPATFRFGTTTYLRGPFVGAQHVGANFSLSCPTGQAVIGMSVYKRTTRVWGMSLKCAAPVGTTKSSRTVRFGASSGTAWAGIKKDTHSTTTCTTGSFVSGLQSLVRDKAIGSVSLSCSHIAQKPMCDSQSKLVGGEAVRRTNLATSATRGKIARDGWVLKHSLARWEGSSTMYHTFAYTKGSQGLDLHATVQRKYKEGRWVTRERALQRTIPKGNNWYQNTVTDLINGVVLDSESRFVNKKMVAIRDQSSLGPVRGTGSVPDLLSIGKTSGKVPFRYNGAANPGRGYVMTYLSPSQLASQSTTGSLQLGPSYSVRIEPAGKIQAQSANQKPLCDDPANSHKESFKRYRAACDAKIRKMHGTTGSVVFRTAGTVAGGHALVAGATKLTAGLIFGAVTEKGAHLFSEYGDNELDWMDVGDPIGFQAWSRAIDDAAECQEKNGCDGCRSHSDCQGLRGGDFSCNYANNANTCIPTDGCMIASNRCSKPGDGGSGGGGGNGCVSNYGKGCGTRCTCSDGATVYTGYVRCDGSCNVIHSSCFKACSPG